MYNHIILEKFYSVSVLTWQDNFGHYRWSIMQVYIIMCLNCLILSVAWRKTNFLTSLSHQFPAVFTKVVKSAPKKGSLQYIKLLLLVCHVVADFQTKPKQVKCKIVRILLRAATNDYFNYQLIWRLFSPLIK